MSTKFDPMLTMLLRSRLIAAVLGLVLSAAPLATGATAPSPPELALPQLSGSIALDGDPSEEAWGEAVVLERFSSRIERFRRFIGSSAGPTTAGPSWMASGTRPTEALTGSTPANRTGTGPVGRRAKVGGKPSGNGKRLTKKPDFGRDRT